MHAVFFCYRHNDLILYLWTHGVVYMHFFEFVNYVFTCKIQSTYLNSIPFKRFFFLTSTKLTYFIFLEEIKRHKLLHSLGFFWYCHTSRCLGFSASHFRQERDMHWAVLEPRNLTFPSRVIICGSLAMNVHFQFAQVKSVKCFEYY